MKIWKKLADIKWHDEDTDMPISEEIVMASAAGWYVGIVCKDPDCGGYIVPFERCSEYYATPEEAHAASVRVAEMFNNPAQSATAAPVWP